MKALVLGCGSIGLRHIGHLRQLGVTEIEAADPSPAARERVRREMGLSAWDDPTRALSLRPDIVLVCTPAATHIPVTLQALAAGAHVFVEKPLSTALKEIGPLVQSVERDGRILQVGYNLRYHPAIRKTKAILESGLLGKVVSGHAEFGLYLEKWWSGRDYRSSYMANAEEGGGLLLDVSHEIDLMSWFLGPVREVSAYADHLSRLEMAGWDLIKVLMRMESGALVSLSMDCLQPTYTRGFTLAGEDSALRWSCPEGRADTSVGELTLSPPSADRFEPVALSGSSQETYLEELRDFLSSVQTGRAPACGWREAAEVLRVVEAIRRSIAEGRSVGVAGCR